MDIGKKLKTLRIHKNLEPVNMAELLQVSVNTYRKYERNESAPDLNMLEKIAKIHDMEVTDLLSEEKLIFNQTNKKGDNNGLVINQLSEKLIELFEKRLEDKDTIIEVKNETIKQLNEKIKNLESKQK